MIYHPRIIMKICLNDISSTYYNEDMFEWYTSSYFDNEDMFEWMISSTYYNEDMFEWYIIHVL